MFSNHPIQDTNILQHVLLSLRIISYHKRRFCGLLPLSNNRIHTNQKASKQKMETVPFSKFSILTIMLMNPYVDYTNSNFKNRTVVRKTVPYGTVLRRQKTYETGKKYIECTDNYSASKQKMETVPFSKFLILTIMLMNPYVDCAHGNSMSRAIVRKTVPYGTVLRRQKSYETGKKYIECTDNYFTRIMKAQQSSIHTKNNTETTSTNSINATTQNTRKNTKLCNSLQHYYTCKSYGGFYNYLDI